MTIVVALLAITVLLLAVLIAGLLRSHAAILRRLHELDAGVDAAAVVSPPLAPQPSAGSDLDLPRPPAVVEGRAAADLSGVGPRGEAHAVRVTGTAHDTILVFLSSGCTTCHRFWDELRTTEEANDVRVVVVTKGENSESPAAVADVAPRDLTVVMSSEAWAAYEVPGSPYVVHVDGPSGRVRGEGTGPTWRQVRQMLDRGAGDLDARRGAAPQKAWADAQRERDVDRALLAAGIEPGDPSLYTRADGTTTAGPT